MKKIILLCVLMSLFSLMAACGIDSDIKEPNTVNTKLKIGTTRDTPLYSFVDENGKLVGFDIDVMNEISKRMNMQPEYFFSTQDSKFAGLSSKRFDAVVGRTLIDENVSSNYIFTNEYANVTASLVVNDKGKNIHNLNDITGENTATMVTNVFGRLALSKKAGIVKVENVKQEFDALKEQKVHFLIEDDHLINYFKKNEGNSNLEVVSKMPREYGIGVMLRSDDKKMRDSFNKHINDMKKDGTLEALSNKWFK
ncbi:transporter substrate-binding domain-containing protein [Bacillus cereus group sp. BfR-BA-01380]|uniref:transporter substrate-binding domain-containing protein n=1 Tax=Bacillus cereus group sp. BfR-BA-01380 TaxID=2920324 RepID=UPI001F5690CD|nr:transporter substrate-binding domain-containing protein [Bacillus cereus group sp. BfR-BA-01380]